MWLIGDSQGGCGTDLDVVCVNQFQHALWQKSGKPGLQKSTQDSDTPEITSV